MIQADGVVVKGEGVLDESALTGYVIVLIIVLIHYVSISLII